MALPWVRVFFAYGKFFQLFATPSFSALTSSESWYEKKFAEGEKKLKKHKKRVKFRPKRNFTLKISN
jgi:hypothetical protein